MTQYVNGRVVKERKPTYERSPPLSAPVIEKNVPMPYLRRSKYEAYFEAAKKMEIGDSFLIEYTRNHPVVGNIARATGFKFKQIRVSETHLRVWRIS